MPFKPGCKFNPGQIVHHKRYNYRGVIFDVDEFCQADDKWYQANKTHPKRSQPWYHVLVDGQLKTTYVAEENLELDSSLDPIDHPMIEKFFTQFKDGKYIRGLNA